MSRNPLSGLILVAALALPGAAFATTGGAATGNLPSQRITNNQPNGSGASLGVSPARVRRVQQALNRLGYNAGTVNGTWDRATARAVQNFQAAHRLEPTGNLNQTTLAALGIGGSSGNGRGAGAATSNGGAGNNVGNGGNRAGG